MLAKNKKIKQSGNDKVTVYNFGIPAFQSAAGLRTCPLAGTCKIGCYATQGAYAWSNVQAAYESRLKATLQSNFSEVMTELIKVKNKTAERQVKQLIIRIHDSGDFYSKEYLEKWLKVINRFPNVKFYAYTKMVPLFNLFKKQGRIPRNFTVIYSEGGVMDKLIKPSDRHARVFPDYESLVRAGYSDASKNDLVAIGQNKKIGLIYHGAKSKTWTTNNTKGVA